MVDVSTSATAELATNVLDEVLRRPPVDDLERRPDWGVPLLARMLDRPDVIAPWVAGYRGSIAHAHPALFAGGVAGFLTGLTHATAVEPRLAALRDRVRDRLVARCAAGHARTSMLGWHDYDLILGMSGIVCALSAQPDRQPEHVLAGVHYLLGVSAGDLSGLIIGTDDGNPLRTWNIGRRNHGLGHGVPGVLAALITAWPLVHATAAADETADTITRIGRYLRAAAYLDDRRVWSWTPGSTTGDHRPHGAPSRQAWCYGTPGVAWQLAEAGRVLGDTELLTFALDAMGSLCGAWDDTYYLDDTTPADRYAWCHGVAGVLAVADAFHLHHISPPAAALAEHLRTLLRADLDRVVELTPDLTMLNGVPGPLVVLLSTPDERHWLPAVGLR